MILAVKLNGLFRIGNYIRLYQILCQLQLEL